MSKIKILAINQLKSMGKDFGVSRTIRNAIEAIKKVVAQTESTDREIIQVFQSQMEVISRVDCFLAGKEVFLSQCKLFLDVVANAGDIVPNEIMVHTLSFLNYKEIASARFVCKLWSASGKEAWKAKLKSSRAKIEKATLLSEVTQALNELPIPQTNKKILIFGKNSVTVSSHRADWSIPIKSPNLKIEKSTVSN